MAISITRLSGGNTPADGSDPRTFPAIWNATAATLEANVGVGGASVTTSDTAPADPAEGDLWWKSDEGKLYVYYNDGTSTQWVDAAGPSVAVQSTAPTGYEGQLWLDDTDGSMYVYYTDPGGGSSSWIGAVSRSGGILQVVSTTKTDTFSTTSTSFVDVTGLSVSITPRSTSSKIFVQVSVPRSESATTSRFMLTLTDGSDTILVNADTPGSRKQAFFGGHVTDTNGMYDSHFSLLHSPSTTSTVTYKVRAAVSGNTGYVNRSGVDSDTSTFVRGVATITAIEVAG